ncbi:MAG: hypothetical protein F6K61_21620 [Sphaerospermopsis sp. SIO1G1]|nr:hypothetical protein [Sphaerospermopsis sp. SIO1G1]
MARVIERIEKDITNLKQEVGAIATELHSNYLGYLTILGAALQKQLILATYHLCTQGYPDAFMKLSLNQRQQLQQGIRQLGKQGAENLLLYIQAETAQQPENLEDVEELEDIEELEGVEELEDDGDIEELEDVEELEDDGDIEELEDVEDTKKNQKSTIKKQKYLDPSNPMEVIQWHQDLEEHIQDVLRKISQKANSLLQKFGMLPQKIPNPILAAAAAAASEASADVMPGPPNLLNLVIEISGDKEAENTSLTPMMTINLRLGDIEFADTKLLSSRKQIRNILLQLNKLGKDYQKKYKELNIAEAEAAWRASWFED